MSSYPARQARRGVRRSFTLAIVTCTVTPVLFAQATSILVSATPAGVPGDQASFVPRMSADARFISFDSTSTDLVPSDTNGRRDVFVRDLSNMTTTRVSLGLGGAQANGDSAGSFVSGNGEFISFSSRATNLVLADTNNHWDLFVVQRQNGTMRRVSVSDSGMQGDLDTFGPSAFSFDGRYLAYSGPATNLVSGDFNATDDVFVFDMLSSTTSRVSVRSDGAESNGWSRCGGISDDGTRVVFESDATNLVAGDTNGVRDVFVHDRSLGQTWRVNVDALGAEANGRSVGGSISGDGRFVAFESQATNLVANDTNGVGDVFVQDLFTGGIQRVSISSRGAQADAESGYGFFQNITITPLNRDGRFVAFMSMATNLVSGGNGPWWTTYRHDRLTGQTIRIGMTAANQPIIAITNVPAISADGQRIAFQSAGLMIVPGDNNFLDDIFLRDLGPLTPVTICAGDGSAAPCPCGNSGAAGRGCNNSAGTGGAWLLAGGVASLSSDSLTIYSSGERSQSLTLFVQGDLLTPPTPWGDGLRCVGGFLRRLYVKRAGGGAAVAPEPGDLSISARSAQLGDEVPLGSTRLYQTYYRDLSTTFCPSGGNANWSNALAVVWGL